ncbi:MAG TPA: hydrogenase, partial [Anaeromyxobacteraceae bacterium]|nr:hydrogenase [Anaeromyxobacteraceae bacterium]
ARLGMVGPAARASGLGVDARRSHPFPPYDARPIPVVVGEDGDVHARAWVRFEEARHSALFVVGALSTLPPGPVRVEVGPPASGRMTVSLVEGWRGEICHAVVTGADGRFTRYEIVDPSFHDWMGLQVAMRGGQISDFPLCNKSFNLSYSGHDL